MKEQHTINQITQEFSVFLDESNDYLKTINNLENLNLSKEHLAQYISFMQTAPVSIVFIDDTSRVLFTNKNFEQRMRKRQPELIGQSLKVIFPTNFHSTDREEIWNHVLTHNQWNGSLTYLDKDSQIKKIWLKIKQFKNSNGSATFGIQFFDSGTLNFRSFSENTYSYFDIQTKLPNFNQFSYDINQSIRKKDTEFAGLALIRCQNLSEISMHHSRPTHKLVTNEMVKRIRNVLPRYFYLYRLSREIFALYSSDYNNEDDFKVVVQKIREALLVPLVLCEQPIFLNVEIGVAFYPNKMDHLASLLSSAEICLNQRDTSKIVYFSNQMIEKHVSNIQIIEKLQNALDHKLLHLKYQPIFDQKGQVKAAEALIYWEDENIGVISTKQLLEAVIEYGHTYKLNRWMLNQLAQDQLCQRFKVIIHLEPSQLMEESFFTEITSHVKNKTLTPNQVYFEITELQSIQKVDLVIQRLKELKAMGFGLAINDLGIGFSNFNLLTNLTVDVLKIDASFMAGLEKNSRKEIVLQHIIHLAQELGLMTCCEGIETIEELNLAIGLGADCLQGFYFSKALTINDFFNQYR